MPRYTIESTASSTKFIINPNSGTKKQRGLVADYCKRLNFDLIETSCRGDAINIAYNICKSDPFSSIVAVGGDGLLSETANGIMRAGAGHTATLSGLPLGDGNDFIRAMSEKSDSDIHIIDLMSINGLYSLNMINIGFDCNVVINTDRLQKIPGITGSFSYIMGIAATFIEKKPLFASITVDGTETLDGEFLLIAVGNCSYCGGGIRAIPTADPSDGKFDVLIIKNVTRRQFVSMFGDYKNGTHFISNELGDKYKKIIEYRHCSSLQITGAERFCVDGEIVECAGIRIDMLPCALRWQNFDRNFIDQLRR